MKPMLLIVTAIVAFGSIVARADGIDTEHLFGFTIGTDIGELGVKGAREQSALLFRAVAGTFLGIYGEPESSSRGERRRRLS
jgi:hypothetical protein